MITWAAIIPLILIPTVKGHCSTIQCYTCDDCDFVSDCLLQSCPSQPTTLSPIVTSTSATFPPTATSPSTIKSSTTTTTTIGPTNATATTTTPITYTTTKTTSDIIIETTEESASTTDESNSDSPTEEETTEEPIQTSDPELPVAPQRSASDLEIVNRFQSALRHRPAVSYHCYSIEMIEDHKRKKRRGCVKVQEEEHACTVLKNEFGCSVTNCKVCSENRCNNSSCDLWSPFLAWLFGLVVILLC